STCESRPRRGWPTPAPRRSVNPPTGRRVPRWPTASDRRPSPSNARSAFFASVESSCPPSSPLGSSGSVRTMTATDVDVLLGKAYEGEALGEAFFGRLGELTDEADHRAKLDVLRR